LRQKDSFLFVLLAKIWCLFQLCNNLFEFNAKFCGFAAGLASPIFGCIDFNPKLAALILSKAGCTDFIQSWLHST